MSEFDPAKFLTRISGMTDDELIAQVSINASSLSTEALEIARSEADRRGLTSDIQPVLFDIYMNTGGFAGRFILLEEQLIFLSTGMRAAGGTGGGSITGAIMGEAAAATRNLAAAALDFSALDNEGSWIYYLDQIEECRGVNSILRGNELEFRIREEDGSLLDGVVKCSDLSKNETAELAQKIIDARDSLKQKNSADKNGA